MYTALYGLLRGKRWPVESQTLLRVWARTGTEGIIMSLHETNRALQREARRYASEHGVTYMQALETLRSLSENVTQHVRLNLAGQDCSMYWEPAVDGPLAIEGVTGVGKTNLLKHLVAQASTMGTVYVIDVGFPRDYRSPFEGATTEMKDALVVLEHVVDEMVRRYTANAAAGRSVTDEPPIFVVVDGLERMCLDETSTPIVTVRAQGVANRLNRLIESGRSSRIYPILASQRFLAAHPVRTTGLQRATMERGGIVTWHDETANVPYVHNRVKVDIPLLADRAVRMFEVDTQRHYSIVGSMSERFEFAVNVAVHGGLPLYVVSEDRELVTSRAEKVHLVTPRLTKFASDEVDRYFMTLKEDKPAIVLFYSDDLVTDRFARVARSHGFTIFASSTAFDMDLGAAIVELPNENDMGPIALVEGSPVRICTETKEQHPVEQVVLVDAQDPLSVTITSDALSIYNEEGADISDEVRRVPDAWNAVLSSVRYAEGATRPVPHPVRLEVSRMLHGAADELRAADKAVQDAVLDKFML